MLIAADDAILSGNEAGNNISEEVDEKFRKAIQLLNAFEKDFPSKDPMFDPNICQMITSEEDPGVTPKSPLTILYALTENLHSKVNFPSVSSSVSQPDES